MMSTSFPGSYRGHRTRTGESGSLCTTGSALLGVLGLLKAKSRLAHAAFRARFYRSLIIVTTALMALGTPAVFASEFRPHEMIVSDPATGAALFGFDPVAYQLERRARAGKDEHQASFGGKAWHFASASNRMAFLESPESYAPLLGGHDPMAIAAGLPVAGDPRFHALKEGRLLLFRNEENRSRFLANPAILSEAERVWPEVKRGLQP